MKALGIKPMVMGEAVALVMGANPQLIHPYSTYEDRPIDLDMDAVAEASKGVRQYMLLGAVVGDGIGEGAAAKLKQRYFVVSAITNSEDVCADPEVIETLIPDLDNLIVAPVLHRFSFKDGEDLEISPAIIGLELEKCRHIDEIFWDFGCTGPGSGIEVVPLQTVKFEAYEGLRTEHLLTKPEEKAA